MTSTLALVTAAHIKGPHIDWAALSPIVVLAVGALVVLLIGLVRQASFREGVTPIVTIFALVGAVATEVWRLSNPAESIVSGALRIDGLALVIDLVCAAAAIATVILAWRSEGPRSAGQGEFYSLLLFSVMGMAVFVSAQDFVTLFIGIELLSIPLYILCAAEYRREGSLESGLKYLIIGSVGSATLAYGLALIYGATGHTGFDQIAAVLAHGHIRLDPLLLTGVAMVLVGFAFKTSVAPFHQWTPDVYQGAPTPITAFMATATKAAAVAVFLRFFDVALISDKGTWGPIIAALATVTIIVGNVGALGQTSVKRLLGYSGVAQAGYILSGVVVATQLGVSSSVFYLIGYLLMNIAVFAAVHAQETEVGNDRISSLAGLGKRSPALAWGLTVGMLGLAGIPGTIGFIGKFRLIQALVDGGYGWLAVILVVGAMISLGYYLRVVAVVWMSPSAGLAGNNGTPVAGVAGPGSGGGSGVLGSPPLAPIAPIAGASAEADKLPYPEVVLVGAVFGAMTIVFGVIPGPIFHLAAHAGAALTSIL